MVSLRAMVVPSNGLGPASEEASLYNLESGNDQCRSCILELAGSIGNRKEPSTSPRTCARVHDSGLAGEKLHRFVQEVSITTGSLPSEKSVLPRWRCH